MILLRTKLHRPPIIHNHVHRSKLLERLDNSSHKSVNLISAPAGYGKSMLVSCWLEVCKEPGAWLSIDQDDNDLRRFLSYFIAAIQTIHPHAACQTKTLIDSTILPPHQVLATTLVNELDLLGNDFNIVLDDIHHIHDKIVHDFLNLVLKYPPRNMNLVLVGRRDPLIAIATLRARGKLAELRMRDLRFTMAESITFLQAATTHEIDLSTISALAKKTEGWVTGLHLVALAMQGEKNPGQKLLKLKGTTHYVVEYLINEVLDHQPADIRTCLLHISILDRFCAPLCKALCEIDGMAFINGLMSGNLFIISLDEDNQWFRYHHLFQTLLRRLLNNHLSPEDIRGLHDKASQWFASQNLIDEALAHAMAAGKPDQAADIVELHRLEVLNADRWPALARWLSQLPEKIIWQRPELLLGEAWLAYYRFRIEELVRIVARIEVLLNKNCNRLAWEAELSLFKSYLFYWQGHTREMLIHVAKAQAGLPHTHDLMRADSEIYFGLAHHMAGQKQVAIKALTNRIKRQPDYKSLLITRQIITLAFIHLLSGSLQEASIYSRQLGELARYTSPIYIKSWSTYLLGCCHFQSGNWKAAERCFQWMADNRYVAHTAAVMSSLTGLGLTLHFMGQSRESSHVAQQLMDFAVETKDPGNLSIAESGQARIALLQGDQESRCPSNEVTTMATAFIFLEAPQITHCRLLVAQESEEAIQKIESLVTLTKDIHNTFHLIDLFVLQAVIFYRNNRLNDSDQSLKQALDLAAPGCWVRPFIELGPIMCDLLIRLKQQNVQVDYVNNLLEVFHDLKTEPKSEIHSPPGPKVNKLTVESLTNRELDVLELLAERLQNKEISNNLSISIATVKTHLRHIYEKLNVRNRRQAVLKAEKIGLLSKR